MVKGNAVLSFILLAVASVAAAAAESIPAALFAEGANVSSAALSPEGKQLVFISHVEGKRVVVVRSLVTKTSRALLRGEGGDKDRFSVSHCWFKTEARLICHFRGFEFDAGNPFPVSRLVAINVDGSESKVLVQNGKAGASQFQDRILHRLPNDPSGVLIQLDDDGDIFPSVFRLDVNTGRLTTVLRQREPVMHWSADRNGVVRFGFGYRERKGVFYARDSAESEWRTLAKFQRFEGTHFDPIGFTSLPNIMLVSAPHKGRDAIWEMDLKDDKDLELLYSHGEVDVDSAYVWPHSQRIAGFLFETDRPQLHLIDPELGAIQRGVDAALPGRVNRVVDGSTDGQKLLIFSYSDVEPGTYYLYDAAMKGLAALSAVHPQLRGKTLAPTRTVSVPGPGGVKIPGYLTTPVGADARKLPALVMPHGGPYARDSWGYDPLLQLLVNRGYAVLQLNYRGSTGYGEAWQQAGYQGWGTVMHDDITAGARWLVESGLADPARLCILGWSYGGYAALIGAVKEPSRYRCAVSIAGVSDLKAIIVEDSRFYGGESAAQASTGTQDLEAQSPRRRAAEIRAPVLLVHGTADIQVVDEHSKAMAKALARASREHELLIIKEGDHSLSRPEMRLALYQRLEQFLARYLGGAEPR